MEDNIKNLGVFPSQMIRKMIEAGEIIADKKNIQPASIDLTISGEIYRMKGTFLPRRNEKIREVVENENIYKADLKNPLERNGVYLIRLNEKLLLSKEKFAMASSKSSTGRVDLQTRLLVDGYPRFDMVPSGYNGDLWLQVIPKSFLVKLSAGERLNQIRLYNCQARVGWEDMEEVYEKNKLLFDKDSNFIEAGEKVSKEGGDKLVMNIDLEGEGVGSIIGYKNISKDQVLNFSDIGGHRAEDFFEPIYATKDNSLLLEKESFYIFYTKEAIRIPGDFSGEMIAYDISSGEFRSHYAGFFDPGFGYGENGEIKGRRAVLEVRSFDNNFIFRDAQPICQMGFEKLIEPADFIYSEKIGSHYANQSGPKLSKHFK
ncbi:MAG: 2'-deoxycytidine 5'-triphosphate deaminase [Candidatus Pacebacteria bacterium]|nr:2'-deoxycytidine 5'-triphosphate deaminase [Candidatus Paceibacterota bacterium]